MAFFKGLFKRDGAQDKAARPEQEMYYTGNLWGQPEQDGVPAIHVDDAFMISGRGLVAVGTVSGGTFRVGDSVRNGSGRTFRIAGIEMFRKVMDAASDGDSAGFLLEGASKQDIRKGGALVKV